MRIITINIIENQFIKAYYCKWQKIYYYLLVYKNVIIFKIQLDSHRKVFLTWGSHEKL